MEHNWVLKNQKCLCVTFAWKENTCNKMWYELKKFNVIFSLMPASWNDQYLYIFTHCGANTVLFWKSDSITLNGIIRPIWTISKYLGLSENQTDSSLPSQLPPAAVRGQKSPAGLISLRKCGANLSIILSLKHPLFFLMASAQLISFAIGDKWGNF